VRFCFVFEMRSCWCKNLKKSAKNLVPATYATRNATRKIALKTAL